MILIVVMLLMDVLANHSLEACLIADDEWYGDEGSGYLHMIVNILFSYNSIETFLRFLMAIV